MNRNANASKSIFGFGKAQKPTGDPSRTSSVELTNIVQELSKVPGGKTSTSMAGHTDLGTNSNRAFIGQDMPSRAASFTQVNRNFGKGSLGESDSLDKTGSDLPKGSEGVTEALDDASKTAKVRYNWDHDSSVRANCSKHHRGKQGVSHCGFCKGAGFEAAERVYQDLVEGKGSTMNKARNLMYQPSNTKV
jgi:hypothetical protein